jgi:hypothetical protein
LRRKRDIGDDVARERHAERRSAEPNLPNHQTTKATVSITSRLGLEIPSFQSVSHGFLHLYDVIITYYQWHGFGAAVWRTSTEVRSERPAHGSTMILPLAPSACVKTSLCASGAARARRGTAVRSEPPAAQSVGRRRRARWMRAEGDAGRGRCGRRVMRVEGAGRHS